MADYKGLSKEAKEILKKTSVVIEGSEASIDFLCDSYLLAEEGMTIAQIRQLSDEDKVKYAEKMAKVFEKRPVIGEMDGGAKAAVENVRWFGAFFAKAVAKLKVSGVKFPKKEQLESIDSIKTLEDSDFMYAAEYAKRFQLYTEVLTDDYGKGVPDKNNAYGIDRGVVFVKAYGGVDEDNNPALAKAKNRKLFEGNQQIFTREMSMLTTLSTVLVASEKLKDKKVKPEQKAYYKAVLELKLVDGFYGEDIGSASANEHVLRGLQNRGWMGMDEFEDKFRTVEKYAGFGKLKLSKDDINEVLTGPAEGEVKDYLNSGKKNEEVCKCLNLYHDRELLDWMKGFNAGANYDIYDDFEKMNGEKIIKKGIFSMDMVRRLGTEEINLLAKKYDEVFYGLILREQAFSWRREEKYGYYRPVVSDGAFLLDQETEEIDPKTGEKKINSVLVSIDGLVTRELKILEDSDKENKAAVMCALGSGKLFYSPENVKYSPSELLANLSQHIFTVDEVKTKEELEGIAQEQKKKSEERALKREEKLLKYEADQRKFLKTASWDEVKKPAEKKEKKEKKTEEKPVNDRAVILDNGYAMNLDAFNPDKEENQEAKPKSSEVEDLIDGIYKQQEEGQGIIREEEKASREDPGFYKENPYMLGLQFMDFMSADEKVYMARMKKAGFEEKAPDELSGYILVYAMSEKGLSLDELSGKTPEEKKKIGDDFLDTLEKKGNIKKDEECTKWFATMLSSAMAALKKEGVRQPKDNLFESAESADRIRFTKFWAVFVVCDLFTRGTSYRLMNGEGSRKRFEAAYGKSISEDEAIAIELSSLGYAYNAVMDDEENDVQGLEERVKLKLAGELFLADRKLFDKADAEDYKRYKDYIDMCFDQTRFAFSGLFTAEEMKKLLSTPLRKLAVTDEKLCGKAKAAVTKAIQRSAVTNYYTAMKTKSSADGLEYKLGFMKDTGSLLLKDELLGDAFYNAVKGEKDEDRKNRLAVQLSGLEAAYKLKAAEAKKNNQDALAGFFSAMEYFADGYGADLRYVNSRNPEIIAILDFVKDGLFMNPEAGESVSEVYSEICKKPAAKEAADAYIELVCGIKELVSAADTGNEKKRKTGINAALSSLRAAKKNLLDALEKNGRNVLDAYSKKPISLMFPGDSQADQMDIIIRNAGFMNEMQDRGWNENDRNLVRCIEYLRNQTYASYKRTAERAGKGDKEAKEKLEYYTIMYNSFPFGVDKVVVAESEVEKLRFARWASVFLAKYGKDPIFDGFPEAIKRFEENKDSIINGLEKTAAKEADGLKDNSAEYSKKLLNLLNIDKYADTEKSFAGDYLEKQSAESLCSLYESLLKQEGTVLKGEGIYGAATSIKGYFDKDETGALGGRGSGAGRIKKLIDDAILNYIANRMENPLLNNADDNIFALKRLKQIMLKKGIKESYIDRTERRLIAREIGYVYFHEYKLLYRAWDGPRYKKDITVEIGESKEHGDANKVTGLKLKRDIRDIRLEAVGKLELQAYDLTEKGYKAANEAFMLKGELKGEEFAGAREALAKLSGFDKAKTSLSMIYEAFDELDACIEVLQKSGKADAKLIDKLDKYYERWIRRFDEDNFSHVSNDTAVNGLIRICDETYKAYKTERSDEQNERIRIANEKIKKQQEPPLDVVSLGWEESERTVAELIEAIRRSALVNYDQAKVESKSKKKPLAIEVVYKNMIEAFPFASNKAVSVKTATDKIYMIRWLSCFIQNNRESAVLADSSELIKKFSAGREKLLASVEKELYTSLAGKSEKEKTLELIRLFESDKYAVEQDTKSYAEAFLNKQKKDVSISLFKSVLKEQADKLKGSRLFKKVLNLKDGIVKDPEYGAAGNGVGMIRSVRDKMIVDTITDSVSNPLSSMDDAYIWAVHNFSIYLRTPKCKVKPEDINKWKVEIVSPNIKKDTFNEYNLLDRALKGEDKGQLLLDVGDKDEINEIINNEELSDIRMDAVRKLDTQVYEYKEACCNLAQEAQEIIENLVDKDAYADLIKQLSKLVSIDTDKITPSALFKMLNEVDKLADDMDEDARKWDVTGFTKKWFFALSSDNLSGISESDSVESLVKLCDDSYKMCKAKRTAQQENDINLVKEKALNAERELKAKIKRVREKEEKEKIEEKIKEYNKQIRDLEKESENLDSHQTREANAKNRRAALKKAYSEQRKRKVAVQDQTKTFDNGAISYDNFIQIFASKGVKVSEGSVNLNLINATFNLLPAETTGEEIEQLAAFAPFNLTQMSGFLSEVEKHKKKAGRAAWLKESREHIDSISSFVKRIDDVEEEIKSIDRIKKYDPVDAAVEENAGEIVDNIQDNNHVIEARESRRITDGLNRDIGRCRNYDAVHAAVNNHRNGQMGYKEMIMHAAYSIAAVQLENEGKRFSVKELKARAKSIANAYFGEENREKYTYQKLKKSLSSKDNAVSLNRHMVNDVYGVFKKADMKKYVNDMVKLEFNMMNRIDPTVRSAEYQALVSAVQHASQIVLSKNYDANINAIAEANRKLVTAAFTYMDDKKSVRSSWDGKARFENALDAIAIVRKYAHGTEEMIDKYVASINRKRKTDDVDARWHVDIHNYGANNAELKEIARENDRKLGRKAMFSRIKEQRNQIQFNPGNHDEDVNIAGKDVSRKSSIKSEDKSRIEIKTDIK